MEIFKIEDLEFTYPISGKKALDKVSLSIKKGEFVVLCGGSGCGKTTLLRHFKPSLSPNGEKSGQIRFYGEKIDKIERRKECEKIGFVMQNAETQIVCDKVWHELAFGLENLGLSTEEIRIKVAETAMFFGLDRYFHKNTAELSGGQKQILNLASVMAMDPEVLILDEPTSQLDPISAQKFLDTIIRLNRQLGVTIIISEHRLEGLLEFSDRVILMQNGRILIDSAPDMLSGKELDDDICDGFPIAVRTFLKMSGVGKNPVSVRDGREWLLEMLQKRPVLTEKRQNVKSGESQTILEFEDVWFRYNKGDFDVLRGLSVQIKKGQIYAVVGGNAVGKTTFLKLAIGLLRADRGKVKIKDKGMRISMIPQNPISLFTEKTVYLDLRKTEEDTQKIQKVAKAFEIESLLESSPFDLSGGELQRAALAKIMLLESDVLLLDEPTKGMGAGQKKRLSTLLKALKENGVTIVLVSHDTEFCAETADCLGMLFDGQILSESEPYRFFANKSFYTTAANCMTRGIIPNVIKLEDVLELFEIKRGE